MVPIDFQKEKLALAVCRDCEEIAGEKISIFYCATVCPLVVYLKASTYGGPPGQKIENASTALDKEFRGEEEKVWEDVEEDYDEE